MSALFVAFSQLPRITNRCSGGPRFFLAFGFFFAIHPSHPKSNGPPVAKWETHPVWNRTALCRLAGSTPARGTTLWLPIAEPLSYSLLDGLRDALAIIEPTSIIPILKLGDVAV